jgi:hypothetical protein
LKTQEEIFKKIKKKSSYKIGTGGTTEKGWWEN